MIGVLQSLIHNTDLSLLVGRRSVVAIDVRPEAIRILELRNRTNPFRRHLPKFEIVHTLRRELPSCHALTEAERFTVIESMLREAKVTTRLVAVPLPPGIARSCLTSVPRDVESVDEWIESHYERLFEFGPRREDATLRYELVAESEELIQIELTCMRTKETTALEESFLRNGFEVVWMGSPARALKCAIDLVSGRPEGEQPLTIGFLDRGLLSVRSYDGGRIIDLQELDYARIDKIPQLLGSSLTVDQDSPSNGERHILLGSRDPIENAPVLRGVEFLSVLSGNVEDTHLVGLAASSFYREIAGVSGESSPSLDRREGKVAKALFERLVLTLGLALLLLLGGMAFASSYLEDRLDEINGEILRSGVSVQGLQRLEAEVKDLRQRLDGRENEGPLTSRLLFQLARLIPDSVYLSSLNLARQSGGEIQLSLTGYAERPAHVTAMLSGLEKTEPFQGVKLLRSASASSPTPIVMPASLRRSPCVVFELSIPRVRGDE
jgi:Tfp pilus assembly protein PilN